MQVELNKRLIGHIEPRQNCAVDGLRHPTDYECLSNSFSSQFHLLYIESSEPSRWQRLKSRYPTLELFHAADSHPVEQQIESLRKVAFATINNEGSLPELYREVDSQLHRIRKGGQLSLLRNTRQALR
jgi:dephospho-CoA kinase